MAAINAQEMVDIYLQAEADLLQGGKDVQLGGRRVTMAELPQIRAGRLEWERRASAVARGGRSGHSLASFGE
ncbi:primosomal replication protein PriB/PriC domain protein [Pseudomonas soli]|uniref:Primosomal replication protein PriB/PriC domain protein n=1 Tax=Pseudomonas soli TaxID=1306993 RepID=A0ABU7GWB2_9PSED|nr:primosomal replication protein PriB/PriC domain protein [Pseudomonas soli]MEE1883355.1 primosomal replication protein PriB/PriC domain protein [Pseudomonas soli]